MILKYHKTLTKEKWMQFPLSSRIIMVANELNRAGNWMNKNDITEVKSCYERAFELLHLTVSTISNKNMLKELLRFREILAEQYLNLKKNEATEQTKRNLLTLNHTLLSLNKDAYNLLFSKPI